MKNHTFSFGEQVVRVVEGLEGLWFCAADAGAALGIVNVRESIANFPDDEVGVSTTDTKHGSREITILSEPGLYRLIFQSRKPSAERFKRWVFAEVLPALRQTGSYTIPGRDVDDEGCAQCAPPSLLTERTAAFLALASGLVDLGMTPVAAGNRAAQWLPAILCEASPAEDSEATAEAQDVARLLKACVARLHGAGPYPIPLSELQRLAEELGLLPECHGTARAAATRLGAALYRHGNHIIDAASGRWRVRRRQGRISKWVFRRADA